MVRKKTHPDQDLEEESDRRGVIHRYRGIAVALLVLLAASSQAFARGGRFRDFMTNPPKVGEKAPLFPCFDEKGKKDHMKNYVGRTHLVLIFGALT
ncbi:MAG: hypothetical protein ACYTHM_16920 [Planctomycetota bacterium]|jgi:hypothetical protein